MALCLANNRLVAMPRHWTINGRFLAQPVTGVQRFAREMVAALDRLMCDRHPLTQGLDLEIVAPGGATIPKLDAIAARTTAQGGGHAWEQLVLSRHATGGLLSLCNTGPLVARRHVVCIHDANTRTCPGSYSLPFRLLYRALLPTLGRRALAVATVSQFSAGELVRLGIAPAEKTRVMPGGHEHAHSWMPHHSKATAAVTGPRTIIVIGSTAPHKNIGMLLTLAPELEAAGLQLAIAGLRDGRVFQSAADSEARNVTFLGRVSDGELAALLDECLCLAVPSLTEGFGLPALEAMARGCPVVVSDCASLPEVCAQAALYAPPKDPAAWMAAFRRLCDGSALRSQLIAQGRARARQFSWTQSAVRYLELMAVLDGFWGAPERRAAIVVP